MGLIFTGAIPLISLFIALFFFFRYYIDKYNLIFVYNREFEGGGIIVKKQVLPLVTLSLYLFQILNFFYFSIIDPYYFKGGLIFIALQSLGLLFSNMYHKNKKREDKIKLARLEESLQDDDNEQDAFIVRARRGNTDISMKDLAGDKSFNGESGDSLDSSLLLHPLIT